MKKFYMLSNRFLVKNIKNNSLRGCVIFEKKVKILIFFKTEGFVKTWRRVFFKESWTIKLTSDFILRWGEINLENTSGFC